MEWLKTVFNKIKLGYQFVKENTVSFCKKAKSIYDIVKTFTWKELSVGAGYLLILVLVYFLAK